MRTPEEIALVEALIAACDSATTNALREAVTAHAATLDIVGLVHPELRDNAERLRNIGRVLDGVSAVRAVKAAR